MTQYAGFFVRGMLPTTGRFGCREVNASVKEKESLEGTVECTVDSDEAIRTVGSALMIAEGLDRVAALGTDHVSCHG